MYSALEIAVYSTLSTIVSICCISGNLLVLISFIYDRGVRTSSNYFIISLAVSDVIIGVISINLLTMYLLLNFWPLGNIICDIWLSIDFTACLVSQLNVFLITLDRYMSVSYAVQYRIWRTDKKLKIMLALAWIIPSIFWTVLIFGWYAMTDDVRPLPSVCNVPFTSHTLFNTVLTVSYFWIPLVFMIILYVGIYRVAAGLQKKAAKSERGLADLMLMASSTMSTIGLATKTLYGSADPVKAQHLSAGVDDRRKKEYSCNTNISARVSSTPSVEGFSTRTDYAQETESSKNYEGIRSPDAFSSNQSSYDSDNQDPWTERILDSQESQNSDIPTVNFHSNKPQSDDAMNTKSQESKTGKLREALLRFQNQRSTETRKAENRNRKRARKALRMISFILGAFILCWMPYHVVIIVKGFCDRPDKKYSCVNTHLYNLAYYMCYMNSPINPFCYAMANITFKRAFARILSGDFRRQ